MTNRQAKLFDHLAGSGCLYAYRPEALAQLNALWPDKGRTLDVGCGDGVITAALDGRPRCGLELSPRCAALARDRGVAVAVGDVLQGLPFAAGSFDTIYCVDVLHHLHQQWFPVFGELSRVLEDGGRLVLVEPDARNPFVRWTQAPRSPIRVAPFDDEPAIWPEELIGPLGELGFDTVLAPVHIEADQMVRDVFPMWQRLVKAPFVMVLAALYGYRANKFVLVAQKGSQGAEE